jgi:hypothetical protein
VSSAISHPVVQEHSLQCSVERMFCRKQSRTGVHQPNVPQYACMLESNSISTACHAELNNPSIKAHSVDSLPAPSTASSMHRANFPVLLEDADPCNEASNPAAGSLPMEIIHVDSSSASLPDLVDPCQQVSANLCGKQRKSESKANADAVLPTVSKCQSARGSASPSAAQPILTRSISNTSAPESAGRASQHPKEANAVAISGRQRNPYKSLSKSRLTREQVLPHLQPPRTNLLLDPVFPDAAANVPVLPALVPGH